MSTSIGPTYDPASTAAALADKYVAAGRSSVSSQTKTASATAKGLSELGTALRTFQASLTSLTGSASTLLTQGATFGDSTIGSASAKSTAAPGTYSFFVERLASASQVSYGGLTDTTVGAGLGKLTINLGDAGVGGSFPVDLDLANTDADTTKLSTRELAAAINAATDNTGLVSASVVTVGGVDQLVLSAKNTGKDSSILLDTGNLTAGTSLQLALDDATNFTQITKAQNATVWLGDLNKGIAIDQATNTFTNIDGVSMTFKRAHATGEAPVTLTVARDDNATTAKVQQFVDAYNKLKSTIDAMVDAGDAAKGVAPGAFAQDAGIRQLHSRLVSLLRPGTAGASLASYGITATRNGSLALDATRLKRTLETAPDGLDTLIGSSAAGKSSGIAGALDTYLKSWSSASNGQIQQRQHANDRLQTSLTVRQEQLDKQYNGAYQRYLLQFTQLQALQSKMASNTSMFDALFSNKSN
jgi:flagellar hook-associated protein 2